MKQLLLLFVALASVALVACGDLPGHGGGGSSNEGNAARVSLDTSPRKIDSGDFTTVSIRLTDVDSIFMIKVRADQSFRYVEDSAFLVPDDEDLPTVEYSARTDFADPQEAERIKQEHEIAFTAQKKAELRRLLDLMIALDSGEIFNQANALSPNESIVDAIEAAGRLSASGNHDAERKVAELLLL